MGQGTAEGQAALELLGGTTGNVFRLQEAQPHRGAFENDVDYNLSSRRNMDYVHLFLPPPPHGSIAPEPRLETTECQAALEPLGQSLGWSKGANLFVLGALGGVGLVGAYSLDLFKAKLPARLAATKQREAEEEKAALDAEEDAYLAPPVPSAKSRRAKLNFFADVVRDAAPAVVYIQAKARVFGMTADVSSGSGTIVRSDGLILTNAHVASVSQNLIVRLADGREFPATVQALDHSSDLATVKIEASGLPCLKLADSEKTEAGEWVVAIGSPLSLTKTVTTGVISSTKRKLTELMPQGMPKSMMRVSGSSIDLEKMSYLQTDAAINQGNSGGPLVNLDGELVGVNSMTIAPATGISFAIPSNHARRFLVKADAILRRRPSASSSPVMERRRRVLGIVMMSLTPEVANELSLGTAAGVLVYSVLQGSAAKKAGLLPGDVIVSIDGQPVQTDHQVREALEGPKPKLRLGIVRRGSETSVTVFPEEE